MSATLVESRPRPFKRLDVDPITLDIIENAMLNARHEMDAVLFRTAMSPGGTSGNTSGRGSGRVEPSIQMAVIPAAFSTKT